MSQILILFLVLIADRQQRVGRCLYTASKPTCWLLNWGALEARQDEGLAEWSRLQIEQGWLADASQIEKTARGVLQMQQPGDTQIYWWSGLE